MNQLLLVVFCTVSLFIDCGSSDKNGPAPAAVNNSNNNADSPRTKMRIKVGNHTFITTLYDNATAAAFKAMLPVTANMVELNRNEKYVDLSRDLPTNASNPGTIKTGDLMLYGSNTLVLFYKTFSTSYSYTEVGRIDDVKGLADAVGSGNVTVIFELE
jgi:hypothetical protein